MDVTPHALGIMIVGGYFQTLIDKNSTVPTSASHIFTTVKDGQTSVKIMVFQGESKVAAENELLGEFILTGLREAPRGEVEIEVNFEISADGIVSVYALDLETGRKQSIVVTATSGLTEDEIRNMVEENQDYLLEMAQDENFENQSEEADTLIRNIRELMPTVEEVIASSHYSESAMEKAQSTIQQAQTAMERRDMESLLSALDGLKKTLKVFHSLAQRKRN